MAEQAASHSLPSVPSFADIQHRRIIDTEELVYDSKNSVLYPVVPWRRLVVAINDRKLI